MYDISLPSPLPRLSLNEIKRRIFLVEIPVNFHCQGWLFLLPQNIYIYLDATLNHKDTTNHKVRCFIFVHKKRIFLSVFFLGYFCFPAATKGIAARTK